MRRLLMVAGGTGGEPTGPLPPDPTLTEWRGVTQMTGTNQNNSTVGAGGKTFRTEYRLGTDVSSLTFTWTSHIQGILADPWTATATFEAPDGTLTPLTFDAATSFTLDNGEWVESDELTVNLDETEVFHLRVYVAEGEIHPEGGTNLPVTYMTGDHRTGTWTPGVGVTAPGPVPVAVLGKTRASVICPAMIGDSIAASGRDSEGWWRKVCGLNPALSYGRNATNFTSADAREGDSLRGATHAIVEYGSNDFKAAMGTGFSAKWAQAVAYYAYVDGLNPGIPIWQTTCLPIVDTTDGCVTLVNQTPDGTMRLTWNAWLRDGAPCDAGTMVPVAVGAAGLRAGQTGHPLAGVLDPAAEVEEGGTSAPTGKWRVGTGGVSWGGDGTHPTIDGQNQMAIPLEAWYATLTA